MAIALTGPRRVAPKPKQKIPDYLIYEVMDGKPIYYKGYRDVLAGKKTTTEIMGASSLQSVIISHLMKVILLFIDEDQYFVLVSEPGVHLNHRDNVSNDIAIFDQAVLPASKISKKYVDVPPKIAIEVDIDADIEAMTESGYIYKKTRKLLDFGVETVFWVLTEAQAVIVANKERIETVDWNRDITLMEGQTFNIGAYLQKKGITVE